MKCGKKTLLIWKIYWHKPQHLMGTNIWHAYRKRGEEIHKSKKRKIMLNFASDLFNLENRTIQRELENRPRFIIGGRKSAKKQNVLG